MIFKYLDRVANFVIFNDSIKIVFGMLGISLSRISLVASGVTSRDDNPVPPVVTIKSNLRLSHQSIKVLFWY
jgi:hypothetical protein